MILHDALAESLAWHPGAVVGNLRERYTYADMAEQADRKCYALKEVLPDRGGERARVAIRRRNSPHYVSDFLAVLKAGYVPILTDPLLSMAELTVLRDSCGIDAVLLDPAAELPAADGSLYNCGGTDVWLPARAPRSRPVLAPRTEVCRLSSGSTRSPACIEFSGAAVLAAADAWRTASMLTARDRILCFAGLYNGLAFNTSLVPGLMSGAGLFLPSGLPSVSNIGRHVEELDITVLVAFPAAYTAMADSARETTAPGSVRLALSSAARLDEATSAVLAQRGLRVADYYGIAETGPLTFNSAPEPGGGQGHPLPGVTLRVDSPPDGTGVLSARSASMGTRYLNYPGQLEARIDRDGFYQTSDQGFLAGNGVLVLTGRVGTALEIGGRKFLGDEIVQLLDSHERVTGSAVATVETEAGHPVLGAVVVPSGDLDAIELRRYLLPRIAPYKVPELIVFVDRLPVNGTGKTQLSTVKDILLRCARGRDSMVD